MSNGTKTLIMIVGCIVLPLLVMLGFTFVPQEVVDANSTLWGVGLTLAVIFAALIGFVLTWGFLKDK